MIFLVGSIVFVVLLIIAIDGISRGSKHMIDTARRKDLVTDVVMWEAE